MLISIISISKSSQNGGNGDRSYFLGLQNQLWMVTAAMKLRHLICGRTAVINLDSILKSRDITLPEKVHILKTMVFPLIMDGCQNRSIKKAECQRTDALKLWCWRRVFRIPQTLRR